MSNDPIPDLINEIGGLSGLLDEFSQLTYQEKELCSLHPKESSHEKSYTGDCLIKSLATSYLHANSFLDN